MIDFLTGASLMNSIGSVAAPAAIGSIASGAAPFLLSAAGAAAGPSFLSGIGSGLGIGSTGLAGTGLGIMGSPGGLSALTQGGVPGNTQGLGMLSQQAFPKNPSSVMESMGFDVGQYVDQAGTPFSQAPTESGINFAEGGKIAKIVKKDEAILGSFIYRNDNIEEKIKTVFQSQYLSLIHI